MTSLSPKSAPNEINHDISPCIPGGIYEVHNWRPWTIRSYHVTLSTKQRVDVCLWMKHWLWFTTLTLIYDHNFFFPPFYFPNKTIISFIRSSRNSAELSWLDSSSKEVARCALTTSFSATLFTVPRTIVFKCSFVASNHLVAGVVVVTEDVNDSNKSYGGATLSNGGMSLYRSSSIATTSISVAVLEWQCATLSNGGMSLYRSSSIATTSISVAVLEWQCATLSNGGMSLYRSSSIATTSISVAVLEWQCA